MTITTRSYGVCILQPFDPSVHQEKEKTEGIEVGSIMANNQMEWLIKTGDDIDDTPITQTFLRKVQSTENLERIIYSCGRDPPPNRRTDEVIEEGRLQYKIPIALDQLEKRVYADGAVRHIFEYDLRMRLLGSSIDAALFHNGVRLGSISFSASLEDEDDDLKDLLEKALRPSRSRSISPIRKVSTSANRHRPRKRYFDVPPAYSRIRREEPPFLDLGQHPSFMDFESIDYDISYREGSRSNNEEGDRMIPGQSNRTVENTSSEDDDVRDATWKLKTGLKVGKGPTRHSRRSIVLGYESGDEGFPASPRITDVNSNFTSSWHEKLYGREPLKECQIRILDILPGDSDEIITELRVVDWYSITDQYEALSYSWGDDSRQIPITVNNLQVPVYPNLFYALSCLRPRSIWIDALSINQKNWPEKSRELPKMGNIYKRAKTVTIFLGYDLGSNFPSPMSPIATFFEFCRREPPHGTINTMQGLKQVCDEEVLDTNCVLEGLLQVARQEWWTRVWILQEFYLAKRDPEWNWGTKREANIWETKPIKNTILRQVMASMIEAIKVDPEFIRNVPLPNPIPRIKSLPIITQLERNLSLIRRGFHIKPKVLDNPKERYQEIWAECKRPQDLIFGLKEIFPRWVGKYIENDYSRAPEEIWLAMVVVLLAKYYWGDLFWWYPSRLPHKDKLPSWLPDLRVRLLPDDNEMKPDDTVHDKNENYERRNPIFRIEDQVLHIKGTRLGVINTVSEIEVRQDTDIVERLRQLDRDLSTSTHLRAPSPTKDDASMTNSALRSQCHDVLEYVRGSLQNYSKNNLSSHTPVIVETFLQSALEDFVEAATFDQTGLKANLVAVISSPSQDISLRPESLHLCNSQRNVNIVSSVRSCGISPEITSLASHLIIVAERLHRLSNQSQGSSPTYVLSRLERLASKQLQSLKEIRQGRRRYFFKTDRNFVGVSTPGVTAVKQGDIVALLDGITFSMVIRKVEQEPDKVRIVGCALVKEPGSNSIFSTKRPNWQNEGRGMESFQII